MFSNFKNVLQILPKTILGANKKIILNNLKILPSNHVRYKNSESKNFANELPGGISSRYEKFSEDDAPIILDVEEEQKKIDESIVEKRYVKFDEMNLESKHSTLKKIYDVVSILFTLKKSFIFRRC